MGVFVVRVFVVCAVCMVNVRWLCVFVFVCGMCVWGGCASVWFLCV